MLKIIGTGRQQALEWHDTILTSCGVGLWDAVFYRGDAMHPEARWAWSAEFRRLLGFDSEAEFPNVVQSWSDRLHPEDAAATFSAFNGAIAAGSHYYVTYRLKMKDGSYRWFAATGGVVLDQQGKGRRACGSLVDIHDSHILQQQQQLAVAQLLVTAGRLAEGDLTTKLGPDFPEGLATLKAGLNGALANIQKMIGAVSDSAGAIRVGSSEIAQASEDLARRTEVNAASLEETSAALAQIDTRLRGTAQASGETVVCADQAIDTVHGGREAAAEAVAAMGRVSDSAKGIDDVIEGLDKIAFQTRVLAMNAAVEAGRAGDAGRGFAVVADLVSALAMRAEEEAKRARDQLTLTQADVVTAVQAVHKVDGALENISSDVGEVHKLLAAMAGDATAQSSAITQITTALCEMDQSTQQNAAMVEETSAAARNLTTEVNSLAEQAAMFKIDLGSRLRGGAPGRAAKVLPDQVKRATSIPYRSPVKPPLMLAGSAAVADEWNAF